MLSLGTRGVDGAMLHSFMHPDKHGALLGSLARLSGASGRSPESFALKQCWSWARGDWDWHWETPVSGEEAGTARRGRIPSVP